MLSGTGKDANERNACAALLHSHMRTCLEMRECTLLQMWPLVWKTTAGRYAKRVAAMLTQNCFASSGSRQRGGVPSDQITSNRKRLHTVLRQLAGSLVLQNTRS